MQNREIKLQAALLEAALWDRQLTEEERTSIPFAEARSRVLARIMEKYKNKIIPKK